MSHENSLNLFGEKYFNESHWPMRRIRLLEWQHAGSQTTSKYTYHILVDPDDQHTGVL